MYKYVPGVMARKRAALMDFREWTWGFVAEAGGDTAQMFSDMSKQMMEQQVCPTFRSRKILDVR